MDAFESLAAEVLHGDGYWVRNGFKVELTKEEKREIDRPSNPRWELDLVGYSAKRDELLVIECKSYLDSRGVAFRAFKGTDARFASRFKLFNDPKLRRVVFDRLRFQMIELGLITQKTRIKLVLACGKIASRTDYKQIRDHFEKRDWELWDCEWFKEKLQKISEGGYENSQISVVSKLLLRECYDSDS